MTVLDLKPRLAAARHNRTMAAWAATSTDVTRMYLTLLMIPVALAETLVGRASSQLASFIAALDPVPPPLRR